MEKIYSKIFPKGYQSDKIEVIFLFDDSKSLLESQSFYFYSFNSIINACNILNFKKPFIISNKLTCKQVRAKILFNNSIDNLFTQLTKLEKITKIFIIDMNENNFNLNDVFESKTESMYLLKAEADKLLSDFYLYEDLKNFY